MPVHERFDAFGVAVGAWVAAVTSPAVGLLGHWRLGWGAQTLALVVLLGGPAVALAVAPLVPPDLAVPVAASRLHPLPAVLPFGFLVPPLAGVVGPEPPDAVVGLSLVGLVVGLFTGLALWAGADNRYAAAMTEGSAVLATWTARPDPARRRQLRILTVALAVLSVVLVVAALALDPVLLPLLGGLAGAAISLYQYRDRPREFTAGERGLAIHARGTVNDRFVPWSRFTGLTRTAESLVLHRRLSPSVRCDVADLEDPDAVRYALERALSGAVG